MMIISGEWYLSKTYLMTRYYYGTIFRLFDPIGIHVGNIVLIFGGKKTALKHSQLAAGEPSIQPAIRIEIRAFR